MRAKAGAGRGDHARPLVLLGLVLAAAASRLLPHPPNFAPVGAMALFAGAHFERRAWALGVPLLAMLVSDGLLEAMGGTGFHREMPLVYLAFAATVGLGMAIRRRLGVLVVASSALAASLLFFVLSNLGTFLTSGLYPHSAAGLVACYVAAVPFFGHTIAGDLVYSALMFGAFALAGRRFPALAGAQ